MKTAILGAGASGLALARTLIERGFPRADLQLFEAGPEPGGLCRSKTIDGFTYDVAGGHILFSKDAGVMQWMKDCAGGDDAFVRRDRNTKIRFGDRFVHYPFENGLSDLPPEVNFDCVRGYVEAWHRRQLVGSSAPDDFRSWVLWRFGDGIAKHFMDPYNEKIWKRPLDQISSGWVAGRVPDAPIADVLKASVGIRTEGYRHQAIFYYPKQGGFQAITDGIGATVSDRVRLNTPVESIVRHGEGWRVNGEDFDRVVNTIPMNELPNVVEGVPEDVAEAMRGLAHNSMTCFLLALQRPEHPDLSWVYLPHPEQGPANRLTYMSNYSPGNAPEGRTSFLCEVTSPGGAPLPGEGCLEDVIGGLVHAGLLKRDEILFSDRTSTRYAYIVFDHELEERRRISIEWCEAVGIHPLGRFGHYDYFNSDQCVMSARVLADELLEKASTG
ncbi:MAG: FAD-dependent oxidoreductase [Planctomycetota bacterium]|nr:FAD-dependent oxidoreductase [Planctomycetota bacterium]